jgi:SAM-dependent methyltransferase
MINISSSSNNMVTARKNKILNLAEILAEDRVRWIQRNRYFYEEDLRYMRFLVRPGLRVLDLGCGIGDLLAALEPSFGVGVDFSPNMIKIAEARHAGLHFICGDIEDQKTLAGLDGEFDVIVLSDTIGSLEDCEQTLRMLHNLSHTDTRIVISYYNPLWEPIFKAGEWLGLKSPTEAQNWLTADDISNLLNLSDFEVIKQDWRQLWPYRVFGLVPLLNRYFAPLPGVRRLCFRNYIVARSIIRKPAEKPSVTVLVPCRNERGNIVKVIERLPGFCEDLEIIFVEGHSRDGTLEEIKRVIGAYPGLDIKVVVQPGKGKADAVRAGFAIARGDILMILDGDMTMPPESLPKFYRALASGKSEFVNGSRLVYPMEKEAMRFLNLIANLVFAMLFSWILNQRFTDTLCGTKALYRKHYMLITMGRSYFGDFDPFGDFDLIFGACKLNLKVMEIPVRYARRTYGETQISRFRHGWLLLKMVIFAYRKFKAI